MNKNGGGGGIRTHGRVAPTRHFQCRTFGHSATPPYQSNPSPSRINGSTLGAVSPSALARNLAEGRGFEPPRDLRPYPISSRTPSTGLGHPSAPLLSRTYLVSHAYLTRSTLGRVEVLPMFSNVDRLRGHTTAGTATIFSTAAP